MMILRRLATVTDEEFRAACSEAQARELIHALYAVLGVVLLGVSSVTMAVLTGSDWYFFGTIGIVGCAVISLTYVLRRYLRPIVERAERYRAGD